MANHTIILGGEIVIGAGIGNSSTVGSATLVRVHNDSGATAVISVTDPTGSNDYSGIGSITMPSASTEYIEKRPSYTVWSDKNIRAAKVGFTN